MVREKGLTLIELVTVLALVAILAGLVTVRLIGSFQGRNLDHFVKELVIFLRYMQFKAIEEGVTHKLEIEPGSGGLLGSALDEKPAEFQEITTPFSSRFRNPKPFSVEFESGDGVYFFPDGRVTPNTLLVKRGLEEKASIDVKHRLGIFKVSHYE